MVAEWGGADSNEVDEGVRPSTFNDRTTQPVMNPIMASKGFGLGSNFSILGAVNIFNEIAWNGSNTTASYTNLVTTWTLDGEIAS